MHISQLAAASEQKIVRATKLALTISASGNPNHPKWDKARKEMLKLIREGVAINPHYRKITPMVADELARWGDWKNATWIWESVLGSRPYVVAILTNVARGHASMGNTDTAMEYLERAKKLQPRAAGGSVAGGHPAQPHRTGRRGHSSWAARPSTTTSSTTTSPMPLSSWPGGRATTRLASKAMESRMTAWPASRAEGHVQLGNMYASGAKDPDKAPWRLQAGHGAGVRLRAVSADGADTP